MTEQSPTMCKKHPEEQLRPCCVCGGPVCGICETYINPVTMIAISKEVWVRYPKEVRIIHPPMEWPKEDKVAHLECAQKKGMTS